MQTESPDALVELVPGLMLSRLKCSGARLILRGNEQTNTDSTPTLRVRITKLNESLAISIPLVADSVILHFTFPGGRAALRLALPEINEFVDALHLRLTRLLRIESLQRTLVFTRRHDELQQALYAISTLAYADLGMHETLLRVHDNIRGLTYAENVLIVLYDPVQQSMQVLYYVDSEAPDILREGMHISAADYPDSLTLALLRYGQPLMGPSDVVREEMGLRWDARLGQISRDWMGVPLIENDQVRGAVVLQIYDDKHHYNDDDLALLTFVAQHTMSALSRKQAKDELERQVQHRTQQLATLNRDLRNEVAERERSQKLQAALFRIVELASARGSLDDFYAGVHAVVGGLLDARNFFIALLSQPGDMLDFCYFVDERDERLESRHLGTGSSEYVIRTRQPLLADAARFQQLADAGKIVRFGTLSKCWLGVPLLLDKRCLGLIVVQSYTDENAFTTNDQEILAFASYHIASAIERKQVQDRLQRANEELEQRVEERTHALKNANEELHAQIGVRQKIESTLKHQAMHDSLTGLPNRASLLDRLARALQRYREDLDQQFAVLFMDLDRFKVVNDSVGHPVGDQLLIEAGRRISRCIREQDSVARLGGDEFTILVESIQSIDEARHIAERVLTALVDPIRIGDKELYTSVSIGIAMSARHYESAEELLRDADVAMYRAKSRGRQRYEIFDQGLHEQALRVLDMEGDLRRAIAKREFEPYLQPIVRLDTGAAIGYEALLRWNHSERGLLLPHDFLAMAEDAGCIEQIDWQLFDNVCRQMALMCDNTGYIGINVSARHFRVPHLADQLLEMIDAYKLPPYRIRIEVTEGALLDNPEQAGQTMMRLRDAGVLATLDDFGTGYSSLAYLHRFPLHALKIDRSFVADLRADLNGKGAAVIRAILALAGSLGMEVIAEGIETTMQHEALLKLNCQVGQGFLFSQPQRFSEFARTVN